MRCVVICKGCGLERILCRAHVVGRGVARYIMVGAKHNLQISDDAVKPTLHGIYDDNILCNECDNKLGQFDDCGVRVIRRFAAEHKLEGEIFSLEEVNGDLFSKFILAIIWRSSISTRPEFDSFNVGPYEKTIHKILLGGEELATFPAIQILLARYRITKLFNPSLMFSLPEHKRGSNVNFVCFALCGFRISVKLDKRPWPSLNREIVKDFSINGNGALKGTTVDFLGSGEHCSIEDMLRAQSFRQARSKSF